jgi:hypothetical protein
VVVTNRLDPNFDVRTFRLREIAFGSVTVTVPTNRCFYQTQVALPPPHATNIVADISAGVDLQNGLVFWTLSAIDLNTGALVESALEGLLPPNDTNHVGEGHVIYTILPRADVPTGAVITNQAAIVFDINPPIETNPTTNTVDALPPTSAVAALPASVLETNFVVSWVGTDDAGGSGLRNYNVYVSDNGGPWQVWDANITGNSDTFNGQPGHYYYFYSRALDNADNQEPAPAGFQASIYVSNNQPPTLQPVKDQIATVGSPLTVTNVVSDPNPGVQLAFSLVDAPAGASIDPATGTIGWVPSPSQGATTNLFTVNVTDNGLPPLSAAQSFLVVVGDYAELRVDSANLLGGQTNCVPLRLTSTASLTNLSFTLGLPAGVLADLSVSPDSPAVALAQLVLLDAAHARITLEAGPARALQGTQAVASVCFATAPGQTSFIAEFAPSAALAQKADGSSLTNFGLFPGRIVLVAAQPVLEAAGNGLDQIQLTVNGWPGRAYYLESASELRGPWTTQSSLTLTAETQTILLPIRGTRMQFFRLRQSP